LNRRRILREIELATAVVINSEGVDAVNDGEFIGWISLQIPPAGSTAPAVNEVVHGRPAATHEAATESAASEAIKRIVNNGDMVIKDLNYDALRNARTELRCACVAACYRETCVSRALFQRDRALRDKENILVHLAHACLTFDDVLPIKVTNSPLFPPELSVKKLVYTGNTPPVTRLEQLACFLLDSFSGPDYTTLRPRSTMDELD
jgi:hypothetical protein